ncbi:unnamed protein product [Cyprideis torosa]|uniref:RING-type E3 ubiquitin transferase n=1 Tax=Cyprideis torosa TaxID=163714 RepID=A0A7R8WIH6_9CRUS|nr:unnamed protein product [Cyprideis torosa]CAG0897913.1 unnamed protein product [Cyprideis torosa]
MPMQAPQWTEFLICPVCQYVFSSSRPPISLVCGHTVCKVCLGKLNRTQCMFDQVSFSRHVSSYPINYALLNAAGEKSEGKMEPPHSLLSPEETEAYQRCQAVLISLAGYLKNSNPQELSSNLWTAVRTRGCQFLGPAMQEEVLKLVILALEDGSALSRKVLVMFIVQRLEGHYPQASKTSIGHVVQLLYRASCFKVFKREGDSSLMQLKEELRNYEALRREHDAQIVQIAAESGLRIAPDQWSSLLYGDTGHKSHMQRYVGRRKSYGETEIA